MLDTEETGVVAGDHLTVTQAGCDVRTDTIASVKQEQDPGNRMPSEEPSLAEAEEDLSERSSTDELAYAGVLTQEVFDRAPVCLRPQFGNVRGLMSSKKNPRGSVDTC